MKLSISKTMLTQWIAVVLAVLALPQVSSLIPAADMAYLAALVGGLTLIWRWLDKQMGAIGYMAIITLVAGLLAVPDIVAIIPPQAAQIVTIITAVLSLVTRSNQAVPPLGTVLGVPVLKKGW